MKIRVSAIRDWALVAAVVKGSETRRVYVLVDAATPELVELSGRANVGVRVTSRWKRGRLGRNRLDKSFVLEIGERHYKVWRGPLVWTHHAFGRSTKFMLGSGNFIGEPWRYESRDFDKDFRGGFAVGPLFVPLF